MVFSAKSRATKSNAAVSKNNSQNRSGTLLKVRDLCCGYGKTEIVHSLDMTVQRGQFVCIIGANGCGKTTALKCILGLLAPMAGSVQIDGLDTSQLDNRQRARYFAYIPQVHIPPFPFRVADVVLLGRTPHLASSVAGVSQRDKLVAYQAMEQLGITQLAGAEYTQLSGGQQQLVLIARALAQEPALLVMDEPTASLDFGNQQLVLSRMHELARGGISVLMVTHDPDHALFCADEVVVMERGRCIACGSPDEVVTSDMMQRIYGTAVEVASIQLANGQVLRSCIPIMNSYKDDEL